MKHISLDLCTLAYRKSGHGPAPMLLFHGFSQDHAAFDLLASASGWESKYTLYSFDLFFHGRSLWGYGEAPIEKDFWKTLLSTFLREEQIQSFSLAGFSIGARFALTAMEAFPNHVQEVYLFAPDGIKINFWYTLATYPVLVRKLFRSVVRRPQRFFKLARLASSLHLIDHRVIRFTETQMKTQEQRERAYYSWVVFRHLKVNVGCIKQIIQDRQLPTTIVIGKNDHVIKKEPLENFIREMSTGKLLVVAASHIDLLERTQVNFDLVETSSRLHE